MIKAEIVVDFSKWKTKIKNPRLYFNKKIKKLSCIKSLKKKNFQFTLLLTNKTFIKKLNKRFRKKNKETDVLSFPIKSHFNKNYKGDIAICYEIINLRSKKTNFNIEFDKMWIHGLLHLLGYDHARQKDYKQMLRKEQDILKRVN
jgi:probable rRNA maturation factor